MNTNTNTVEDEFAVEDAIADLAPFRKVEFLKREEDEYIFLVGYYGGNAELGYMGFLDEYFSSTEPWSKRKFYRSVAHTPIYAERNEALAGMVRLLAQNYASFYGVTMNQTGEGTLTQAANAVEKVYHAMEGLRVLALLLNEVGEHHLLYEPLNDSLMAMIEVLAAHVPAAKISPQLAR